MIFVRGLRLKGVDKLEVFSGVLRSNGYYLSEGAIGNQPWG